MPRTRRQANPRYAVVWAVLNAELERRGTPAHVVDAVYLNPLRHRRKRHRQRSGRSVGGILRPVDRRARHKGDEPAGLAGPSVQKSHLAYSNAYRCPVSG